MRILLKKLSRMDRASWTATPKLTRKNMTRKEKSSKGNIFFYCRICDPIVKSGMDKKGDGEEEEEEEFSD